MSRSLFNNSYIERDPELTGGPRVIARVFGNQLNFSGIIVPKGLKYVLIADIVPDQSRFFDKVKVRINGLEVSNYEIRTRPDGFKVISIEFELEPSFISKEQYQIDIVWNYSEEDLERPDVFNSFMEILVPAIIYTESKPSNGITEYKGSYFIKKDDFGKILGNYTIHIRPIKFKYYKVLFKYFPNYIEFPTHAITSDITEEVLVGEYSINRKVRISMNSLELQSKKFEIVWFTEQGTYSEFFYFNNETSGYEDGFTAPLPVFLDPNFYSDVNLGSVYKTIITEPTYQISFKGQSVLQGKNLAFILRYPKAVKVTSVDLKIYINGALTSYRQSISDDGKFIYYFITAIRESEEAITSAEAEISATFEDSIILPYKVIFTELF